MADITVKAGLLLELNKALADVLHLIPPATPKGRYALAKAGKAVAAQAATFAEQHQALLVKHAKQEKGEPVMQATGDGKVAYDLGLGFNVPTPAFLAEYKDLCDEDIVLAGVRAITHAELGTCPITGAQEAVLLGVFLEDEEPA